jgi:hypothetical protein
MDFQQRAAEIERKRQQRIQRDQDEQTDAVLAQANDIAENVVNSADIRLDQLLQTSATAGQVVTWDAVAGEWVPDDASSLTDPTTTEGDVIYRDGSGLQRLGIGTAGQRLTVNSAETAPEWADVYALRNVLINGDFAIWQRGTSGLSVADAEYGGVDRWRLLYSSAGSTEITATRIDGDTRRYGVDLTQSGFVGTYVGMCQFGEGINCRHLRGQDVTLSMRVRGGTVYMTILQWTGTADAMTSDPVATWGTGGTIVWATNYSAAGTVASAVTGGNWTDISQSVTLGTSFNNLAVIVWGPDGMDVEAAQLEQGPYKTPFETRPTGMELALCQRYFERREAQGLFQTLPGSAGLITGSQAARIPFTYSEKRVAPSLTVINTFDLLGFSSGSLAGNTATLSFSFILTQGCQISASTTSGSYTNGDACNLRAATSSGASLDIDAEL